MDPHFTLNFVMPDAMQAVPLTHGNIAASLTNIAQTYEFVPSDRSYLVMPLFHVHGLMAALLSPLASGSAVILPKVWMDGI